MLVLILLPDGKSTAITDIWLSATACNSQVCIRHVKIDGNDCGNPGPIEGVSYFNYDTTTHHQMSGEFLASFCCTLTLCFMNTKSKLRKHTTDICELYISHISLELAYILRSGIYPQSWHISLEVAYILRVGIYPQSWHISLELAYILRVGIY